MNSLGKLIAINDTLITCESRASSKTLHYFEQLPSGKKESGASSKMTPGFESHMTANEKMLT